jgi:hypothetical protein
MLPHRLIGPSRIMRVKASHRYGRNDQPTDAATYSMIRAELTILSVVVYPVSSYYLW